MDSTEDEQIYEYRTPIRPFHYPGEVKIFALVIVICLAAGLYYLPQYFGALKHYEQGRKFCRSKQYGSAKIELAQAKHLLPASREIRIQYAVACFSLKDSVEQEDGMDALSGMVLTHEEYSYIAPAMPERFVALFKTEE